MSESWKKRCVVCGDEATLEQGDKLYCARHAVQDANPFAAIAAARMADVSPNDAAAQRLAREMTSHKQAEWLERVQSISRSWLARAVFESPRETTPARAVLRWLSEGCKPRVLVLRGGVGVGKSSAALMAVKHWCEPAVFATGPGSWGLDPVKGVNAVTWLRPDQVVSAILHDYDAHAPKLHANVVIDDMGRETRGEFVEALCELLDRDHTVLITTNLTKDMMRTRYGKEPRLISRLNHRAVAIDIKGDSLRKNGGDF